MVSFTELVEIIKKNPTWTEGLPVLSVHEPVRVWRIVPAEPAELVAPSVAPAEPAEPAEPAAAEPAELVAPIVAPAKALTFTIRPYGRLIDPICIGVADLLYDGAPLRTARQIEKEEAIRIEAFIPTLYSAEGGRSRGWTKKMLHTHFQTRAAVGGDLFELQKAKLGFDWTILFTCKETSALFDFFCLAKGIRCAVWKDSFHFGLWPGADQAILTKAPSLFHVMEGRLCNGPSLVSTLFTWVDNTPGAGWIPALSCLSILSSKTIAELEKDATEVGISVTGKKSEQVVQIAAARRRRSCMSSP